MLKHPENISYEQTKEAISNLIEEDKALAALAYATGARVSELILIKKSNIRYVPEQSKYLEIYCPVLKKNRCPKDPAKALKWKKKTFERKALVRLDETWLVTPILNKANSLLNPDDILFPFHRATIFRKLKSSVKIGDEFINPHGFRHLRATHLRKNFGFDAYQLQKFFGWATIEPSSFYVGLDTKEIEY